MPDMLCGIWASASAVVVVGSTSRALSPVAYIKHDTASHRQAAILQVDDINPTPLPAPPLLDLSGCLHPSDSICLPLPPSPCLLSTHTHSMMRVRVHVCELLLTYGWWFLWQARDSKNTRLLAPPPHYSFFLSARFSEARWSILSPRIFSIISIIIIGSSSIVIVCRAYPPVDSSWFNNRSDDSLPPPSRFGHDATPVMSACEEVWVSMVTRMSFASLGGSSLPRIHFAPLALWSHRGGPRLSAAMRQPGAESTRPAQHDPSAFWLSVSVIEGFVSRQIIGEVLLSQNSSW